MSREPKISVLLPVFNGQRYLRQCIESVCSQKGTAFELLIGDDGSTDHSVEICKEYESAEVKILKQGKHLGLFGNLNRLLEHATGDLVQVFCQDDVMLNGCFSTFRFFFNQHSRIGMAYCKSQSIDGEGRIFANDLRKDLPDLLESKLSIQHFYYHGCIPGNLSTVIARTNVLREFSGFNESLVVSGDYDLWARVCSRYPLGIVHKMLVQIRSHGERLSLHSNSGLSFIVENQAIRRQIFPLLAEQAQASAQRYEYRRHGVLEWHFAVRCLLKGRYKVFRRVVKVMGARKVFRAMYWWLITMNNRLYRPQANWILDNTPESLRDAS